MSWCGRPRAGRVQWKLAQGDVIDTTTGEVIRSIRTNPGPHGLTYFPTSKAAHNVGHNGIYVED